MDMVSDKKSRKPNKDIACDVTNCTYHCSENYCTAKSINVGPSYANTTADTICATFRQK
jgi:hypothetical protein